MVRTNQRSLKYLLKQSFVASEHQKWLTKLLGYDFDIQYRPGLENKAADAESRLHGEPTLAAISVPHLISIPDLQNHVANDPTLAGIMKDLSRGKSSGVSRCFKAVSSLKGGWFYRLHHHLFRCYYKNTIAVRWGDIQEFLRHFKG